MLLPKIFTKPFMLTILAGLALLLSACSFSLAEDVTPPPNYTPPAPPETTTVSAASPSYPLVPPDPVKGAAIFAEKCAPCHGASGQGDGSRASALPNPVAAIGSPNLASQSRPADWFNIITNGNLDRFMPPFNGSLSDGQRWDVLAYVYSLSTTPASLAMGGQLYDQNCASCHGKTGKGDGPNASGQMADFTDQAAMAQKTGDEIYQAITAGKLPAMPAYSDKLNDVQRHAVVDYIRFLSFTPAARAAYPGVATPLAAAPTAFPLATSSPASGTAQPLPTLASSQGVTSTASTTFTLGTVTGKVVNGSGGTLPSGLDVALHGFDNMQLVLTDTTTVDSSGTYSFTNIGMPAGRVFVASTNYNDATYSSNIATIDPGTSVVNLDINVFDTTTDASSLSVDRLHIFFDFSNPGYVQVIELYLVTNPTNKTVVPAKAGDPVLTFKLPDNASNLQFQDGTLGDRYVEIPGGFGDTSSVIPGSSQHQVLFGFDLPYTSKLDLLQPVNLPVTAVVVLLPEDGVKVKSDVLTDAGTRDVQGTAYHMYNGDKIDAGGTLSLTLTGSPNASAASPLATDTRNNLIIGLAALGLVMILVGVMLYRRTQLRVALPEAAGTPSEPLEQKDEQDLIDAIIALDDLYKEGKLPDEADQKRRAALQTQLRERMG
jgi:mono/diheme cytochrome c family protein